MECREPLFFSTVTTGSGHTSTTSTQHRMGNANSASTLYSNRFNQQASLTLTPPQSSSPHAATGGTVITQVPLPIPKNVVLISLMEAADRQDLERKETTDDDEDEEFNLDRIISGMSTLSGPCGTYSVTVDGLKVSKEDPRRTIKKSYSLTEEEGGVSVAPDEDDPDSEEKKQDSACALDLEATQAESDPSTAQPTSEEHSIVLKRGQKVQVVDFDDGVAKLARGEGFILASSKDLVKGMRNEIRSVGCFVCLETHAVLSLNFKSG